MSNQPGLFDEVRILPHISKQHGDIEVPNKVLLRPDEVAIIFQVAKQTVYLWCQLGVIPSVKCGGVLRIRRDVVIKILDGVRTF